MKQVQIVILFLIFIVSCKLNEPHIPEWDSEWTIYLPVENYNMADAIEDDDHFFPDTTDDNIPIVALQVSDSSDWQYISSADLYLNVPDERFSGTLDDISLDKPANIETEKVMVITILEEFLPPGSIIIGDTLPPFNSTTVYPPPGHVEFDEFKHISIISGDFYITFHNNLFLTIRSGMQINVYDDSLGGFIGTFNFDEPVLPGSSAVSDPLDLSGQTISNQFRFEYIIPIEGENEQIFTQDMANGSYHLVVSMSELSVSEALAKIPAQQFNDEDAVDITTEKHRLRFAHIEKGDAAITLTNNLPVSADIVVEFPNFRDSNDQTMKIYETIAADGVSQLNVDFSGYDMAHHQAPGTYIDSIAFYAVADVDSTSDYISISSSDSFVVDVAIDTIMFSSVEGQLDSVEMDIESTKLDLFESMQDIQGKIRFDDLTMTLNVQNQVNFPVAAQIKIAGYHRDNISSVITDSVVINIDADILPASTSPQTSIVLDANSSDPSIVDLFEILPTEIIFSGQAQVYGDGDVEAGQGLRVLYNIESPFNFNITEAFIYEMQIDSIKKEDIDEDTRERISKDLLNAKINFSLDNGLPLAADVFLFLAADSTNLDTTQAANPGEKLVIKISVDAGQVGTNGYVENSTLRQSVINLSNEDLQLFLIHPLYMKQKVVIKPSGQPVKVRQADEIKLDASINMKVMINRDDQ